MEKDVAASATEEVAGSPKTGQDLALGNCFQWPPNNGGKIKPKRYTEEQIIYALKQAESGRKVGEITRTMGISEQTFYTWKKDAGLGVSELRELKVLQAENRKLKQLVADLSLDKHILQEVLSKKL